jgi:hypothetical protein
VVVLYYLADDSVQITEPKQDNSGIPQVSTSQSGCAADLSTPPWCNAAWRRNPRRVVGGVCEREQTRAPRLLLLLLLMWLAYIGCVCAAPPD